jgi:hypothetical protein
VKEGLDRAQQGGRGGVGDVVGVPDKDQRRAREFHPHPGDALIGAVLGEVHDRRRLDARLRKTGEPWISGRGPVRRAAGGVNA